MTIVEKARKEMHEKVIKMYKEGIVVARIAEQNGITSQMVYYILKQNNVTLRK